MADEANLSSPAADKPPSDAPAHEPGRAGEEQIDRTPALSVGEGAGASPGEAAHEEHSDGAVATADPPAADETTETRKRWYVVKVTSGREDTIKEAIERRMRKEGLEEYFGQIVIPVEKITEVKVNKAGRKVARTKDRKLYPGYLMVEVEYNDRILYLFRETSGVGDFVGSHPGQPEREPTPMTDREIQRMMGPKMGQGGGDEPTVATKPVDLDVGDNIRVQEGPFKGMEGTVKTILEALGKVKVEVGIFGRPVEIDLEYYQVERL